MCALTLCSLFFLFFFNDTATIELHTIAYLLPYTTLFRSIDNVDRQIVETLREISSPPTVSHFVVMASAPDQIEAGPFDMALREADYNSTTVTGKLVWEDFLNQKYPAHDYAPANFPGLF